MQSLMSQNWTDLWRPGYGPLLRDRITVQRVDEMVSQLTRRRVWPDDESIYRVLAAADRLTSAAMWLVLHMVYARRVDVTGAPLGAQDFKHEPVGRIADALQIVPAFIGYLTANVLSGRTRSWVIDSECCVAAIEAVNTLTGDVSCGPMGRYNNTSADLSSLVADFSSCAFATDERPPTAVGGSAAADTAGAGSDRGEMKGLTDLQDVHMPPRGESLVALLGDGASDGQRALDGSPRRWRAEDCGLITPIMILNTDGPGARNAVAESGKAACLDERLRTCGFDPITIDGQDPAAFAWAILEAEDRLKRFTRNPDRVYPAPMPYVVGSHLSFGLAGGEPSHTRNLLLGAVARRDGACRRRFNAAAAEFFVPAAELAAALGVLQTHALQGRPPESRRASAVRESSAKILPGPS